MPTSKRNVIAGLYDSFAYEALTVAGTAVGFTTATLEDADGNAQKIFATLETAQIRYTLDGTTPTSTVGHLLEVGDTLQITGSDDIVAFRAIRTGGTSASLKVTYSR